MSIFENEEIRFMEACEKGIPYLETISSLYRSGAISLKNQEYKRSANQQIIVQQEKQIAENKAILDDVKNRIKSEYADKEAQMVEREKMVQLRSVEQNHQVRELDRMKKEFEKTLWEARDKKAVKA